MTLAPALGRRGAHRRPSQLAEFRRLCEAVAGASLDDPAALHAFSVGRPRDFWGTVLDWADLPWSGSADVVLTGDDVETARFFPDVRLNYAEVLLRPLPGVDDDRVALTSVHADRPAERWSRAELRTEVLRTAEALTALGLRSGERIVIIAPHTARTIVAALAGAALGAAVSTAASDMGAAALLGRFEQVEPVMLLLDRTAMGTDTVRALVDGLPSLRRLVLLDAGPRPDVDLPTSRLTAADCREEPLHAPAWERRPFDTPLFVMFSSGTTGPPKAMVHGAGGTLLEHVKELRLHVDLQPEDTLYFHTTTAWMMWNWQLSALAVGAHVVVNDAPVTGPESLWELVAEHGVTVFGTSPAYLQLCQDAGYRPAGAVDLSRLRAVLSTGAVLHEWLFDWVADAVGPVPLQSISGGTDIIGCFVLGSPEQPVRPGRCQTRSLGLDVAAVDGNGVEVVGEVGELVCRAPFPSRPLGFLRDPDGARFHSSYFAEHPGMWSHGDLIEFDLDGSARLYGRSDGVLNIDGVRIGPSEIYTVLRGVPGIVDSMAVEQRDPGRPGGTRMVLLVVLAPDTVDDAGLQRTIRRRLRSEASAAHVPAVVVAVPDLPLTHNGKRSERAARDAVNGDPIVNAAALRNPECLDAVRAAVEVAGRVVESGGADDDPVLGAVGRIWSEVLGVPAGDPDDDFADLGGSSRQVLSLLRRIRLDLGVDVPVADFAQRPTLRGLAEAVANAGSSDAASVTELRPGQGRPVFFVPDAWGQLNLYAGLVERLSTDRPLLGLQLPLTDVHGRHKSIEEVAADALEEVRRVQPTGPYSLIGYSFGGLVAFEMAVRLRATGDEVPYLGLLDVRPPESALSPGEIAARRRAARLRKLLSGQVLTTVARRVLRRGATTETAPPPSAVPEAELGFFLGSEAVSDAYRPGAFDGAVTFYLADGSRRVLRRTLSAWRRRSRRLHVLDVPGHHGDIDDDRIGMLSDRHVTTLAGCVSATLA